MRERLSPDDARTVRATERAGHRRSRRGHGARRRRARRPRRSSCARARALTRFANNEIHQNVAEDDTMVNLRFVDGLRVGVASANRHGDDDLARLAESAAATARLSREQGDLASLPAPRPDPAGRRRLRRGHGRGRPGGARRRRGRRHRGGRGCRGLGLRLWRRRAARRSRSSTRWASASASHAREPRCSRS